MGSAAGSYAGALGGTEEPLSWPELFGLIETSTGYRPWEVVMLDSDDAQDLGAAWRKYPPAPLALDRLRQVVMVGLGVKEQGAGPFSKPQGEAETRAFVDMLNRAHRGNLVIGQAPHAG